MHIQKINNESLSYLFVVGQKVNNHIPLIVVKSHIQLFLVCFYLTNGALVIIRYIFAIELLHYFSFDIYLAKNCPFNVLMGRKIRMSELFNWYATRGFNEEMLIDNLPEDLQRDVRRHIFKFVKKVRFNPPFVFMFGDDHLIIDKQNYISTSQFAG